MGQGIKIKLTTLSEDVVKEQESKTELQELCEKMRYQIRTQSVYYPTIDSILNLIDKALELEKELIARREQVEELTKLVDQDLKHIDKLVRYIKAEDPAQAVVVITETDCGWETCKILPRGELEEFIENIKHPYDRLYIFANELKITEKKIYDIEVNSDMDKLIEEIYG